MPTGYTQNAWVSAPQKRRASEQPFNFSASYFRDIGAPQSVAAPKLPSSYRLLHPQAYIGASSLTIPQSRIPTAPPVGVNAAEPYRGVQGQYTVPANMYGPGAAQAYINDSAARAQQFQDAYDAALGRVNAAYEQAQAAAQRAGIAPGYSAPSGYDNAYVEDYNIPYGVDPTWYRQFTQEHDGRTPERVYQRDGEYAIAHALQDKAWGEQFYRTYGRPPSDYDWKASYSQRQRAFYG